MAFPSSPQYMLKFKCAALQFRNQLPQAHLRLLVLSLCGLITIQGQTLVSAQTITPAQDGTGTIVTPDSSSIDIQGGSLSSNGQNLFHSFQEFGLSEGQIANFLSNPQIRNILTRVVGGNPSVINGLIQVSNGNSNLFFLNPAGIIFGNHASLNVPGDFHASTATGIGFDDGNWFNIFNTNNFQQLNGNPSQFAFDLANSGTIINAGNLTVTTGSNLTLSAGQVINTGTISAPEGNIILSAIPGTNSVKISQQGSLLSLEIEPPRNIDGTIANITPLDLPQLLTGSNVNTGLQTQPNGTVKLSNNQITMPQGAGITVNAGNLDVSGQIGGNIQLLGNQVNVIGSNINASGINGGGKVLIGGDYQGQGTTPTADYTWFSGDSAINANALVSGNGGKVIIWGDNTTYFLGSITAQGGILSGNGGFVETSGKQTLTALGTVNASATNGQPGIWLLDPNNITIAATSPDVNVTGDPNFVSTDDNAIVTTGSIETSLNSGTNVTITTSNAGANSQVGRIEVNGRINKTAGDAATLTLTAHDQIILNNSINSTFNALNVILNGDGVDGDGEGNVVINQPIFSNGGDITINGISNIFDGVQLNNSLHTSGGNITITGVSGSGVGINVNQPLESSGGAITLTGISTDSQGIVVNNAIISNGGDISLLGTNTNQNSVGILINQPIDVGTGTLLIATDSPNISNSLSGSGGILTIQPQTTDLDLTIGGFSDANTTFLNNNELSFFSDGFSQIIIGSANGSGMLTLADNLSFSDPVTLRSPVSPGAYNSSGFNITGTDNFSLTLDFSSIDSAQSTVDLTNPNDPNNNFENSTDFETSLDNAQLGDNLDVGSDQVAEDNSNTETESDQENTNTDVTNTDSNANFDNTDNLDFEAWDQGLSNDFSNYLKIDKPQNMSLAETQIRLSQVQQEVVGIRPGLIYARFKPVAQSQPNNNTSNKDDILWEFNTSNNNQSPQQNSDNDQLELILVTASGDTKSLPIEGATRGQVIQLVNDFRQSITNLRRKNAYLKPAQQLYQLLVAPLEDQIKAQNLNNLVFIMDAGLRFIPVAALHDGKQFIIEKYSVGMMPSFSLTNTEYQDLRNTEVLAMGADTFKELNPLPGVPLELKIITQLWKGESFLNQEFTIKNLEKARTEYPFGIIHLATHGEFKPGQLKNSYIQFGNQRLTLDQLPKLHLDNPPINLLVLSACRTAVGDQNSELGFAGLAVKAGVKSALGSMWYVSDEGTLALMTRFYEELMQNPVKTEALRQAQLAMLRGEVHQVNGQLVTRSGSISLPPQLRQSQNPDLSNPYYWSAFTLIGNPW